MNALADAGLRQIEVGSFVNPKWVPQRADTDEVTAIGDWAAPHNCGIVNGTNALRKFRWKESNQTWYAQQCSDDIWYSWDNSAQNWVTTGSTDNPS